MPMEEERYRATVNQNMDRIRDVSGSLSQFVLLLGAVAAGVGWMRSRPNAADLWPEMRGVVIGLIVLLGVQAIVRIGTDVMASWSLRKTEATLTRGLVPVPRFPRSYVQECVFVLIILAATIGGIALVNGLR